MQEKEKDAQTGHTEKHFKKKMSWKKKTERSPCHLKNTNFNKQMGTLTKEMVVG